MIVVIVVVALFVVIGIGTRYRSVFVFIFIFVIFHVISLVVRCAAWARCCACCCVSSSGENRAEGLLQRNPQRHITVEGWIVMDRLMILMILIDFRRMNSTPDQNFRRTAAADVHVRDEVRKMFDIGDAATILLRRLRISRATSIDCSISLSGLRVG